MLSLKEYGESSSSDSDDSDSDSNQEKSSSGFGLDPDSTLHRKGSGILMKVDAAPPIVAPPNDAMDPRRHVDPTSKEIAYNPKYEELFAPIVGPENPFKTDQEAAVKNTLAGFVEPAHVDSFQFELQRRTFHSYGYAYDPSIDDAEDNVDKIVGNEEAAKSEDFKTVFEADSRKRPLDTRKKEINKDPSDIEGFIGPWGKFVDEVRVSKPSEEDTTFLEDYLSKMKKRAKTNTHENSATPLEEKSQLHIKDPYDYQGRSFLHIPQDVGINLKSDTPPDKCFIPKRQIHAWTGHNKGVSVIKWFPKSAHLILSGSMDARVKLWEVYKNRRCVRTYTGHKQGVKDLCFNNSGDRFLSTSYDRYVKLWDTETGDCLHRFSSKKIGYCVKFNPDYDKQNLFLVGTADKKIICWDTRSGQIVQEYDRHLGAVNTITFIDQNRRFVSTSDDKSLRVWEWDIPVDMKYIADPSMHSIPSVAKAPNDKWLAGQSLDNKICVFTCGERFKPHKKKSFKGHMVAGYACGMDFSPEMSYIASGDGDGKCCIWDWKTTRMVAKWRAHEKTCIDVLWHPHETSKLATAGWDGLIKYWD